MANFIFTKATKKLLDNDIDFVSDTIRVMLIDDQVTVSSLRDSAEFVDDVEQATYEYDGSGYTRQDLGTKATTEDAGNNRTEATAAFTSFGATVAAGTNPAAGALVYKFVSDDTDSPVIGWYDDGDFPQNGTGSSYKITWNTDGVFHLTAS